MPSFVLVEFATGYTLFEKLEQDEVGLAQSNYQGYADHEQFKKVAKLKSFAPFKSAAHALENANDVSEGIMNEYLKSFLEMNLHSEKGLILGVGDAGLAGSIKDGLKLNCVHDESTREFIRGVRNDCVKLLPVLKDGDIGRAQLGLGHAYSRSKVKFNVNRVDNMITQSIALLDQLDKDINTFSMRVREWYGWHFPELIKIVSDNAMYCKLVQTIKNKSELGESKLDVLVQITEDSNIATSIINASRMSMGTDISEIDMTNVLAFTTRVISLAEYRKSLYSYLCSKMHAIAPNVSALIGEIVGARLIAHAGSLTNLAKAPASTVQILGAEKALFRALKTKGNTPKYGLIYHSSFIGRAGQKNKGRISRVLANKVSLASRIDCFIDTPTSKYGDALRAQVEERLEFYEHGTVPNKNIDVMGEVAKELALMEDEMDLDDEELTKPVEEKKKRKEAETVDVQSPKRSKSAKEDEFIAEVPKKKKKQSKEKKEKKAEKVEATEKIVKSTADSKTKEKDSKMEKKEKKEKKSKK